MSALFHALEARGVSVEADRYARFVEFRHGRDQVSFELKEHIAQTRHLLTEAERAEHWNRDAKWRHESKPTGLLRGKLTGYLPSRSVPTTWREEENTPIEDMLAEMAASILTAIAFERSRREEREAEERGHRLALEAARLRAEAEKVERARTQALRDRAQAWREAKDLRRYVQAVVEANACGDIVLDPADLNAWRTWAMAQAQLLDPIANGDATSTATIVRLA